MYEFEERMAILVIDGGLSEDEAIPQARCELIERVIS
jgi:hypothetical protein